MVETILKKEKQTEIPIDKWMKEIRRLDLNTFEVATKEMYNLGEHNTELAQEVARETVVLMGNDKMLGKAFLEKTAEWLEYINDQSENWPWYTHLSKKEWTTHKKEFKIPTAAEKYVALVKPISCAAYPSNNYKVDARTLIEKLIPMLTELDNDLEALYFDIGYLTRKK